jgi:hypothetical protein
MPDVKKTHIMHNDWYWHKFLDHAKNGDYDDPINAVQKYSKSPVHIRMEAYPFNKVPEPDSDSIPSHDCLELITATVDTEFQIVKPGKDILSQFNRCFNLRVLAENLSLSENIHYFWIDLHFGVHLRYGTEKTGNLDVSDLWHRILEPWIEWIE